MDGKNGGSKNDLMQKMATDKKLISNTTDQKAARKNHQESWHKSHCLKNVARIPATPMEAEAIVYLCSSGKETSVKQFAEDLHPGGKSISKIEQQIFTLKLTSGLAKAGLVVQKPDSVKITEAGRIACVFALAQYPELRPAYFEEDT